RVIPGGGIAGECPGTVSYVIVASVIAEESINSIGGIVGATHIVGQCARTVSRVVIAVDVFEERVRAGRGIGAAAIVSKKRIRSIGRIAITRCIGSEGAVTRGRVVDPRLVGIKG